MHIWCSDKKGVKRMDSIYQSDILDIELNRGSVHRSFLNHSIGTNDIIGNRFGVRLFRGGEPVDVEYASCIGYFMRADGETVVINGGLAQSDGTLGVWLPQSCYAVEGNFTLALKVSNIDSIGNVTTTIRIIDGTVINTTTGAIIDPGTIVPALTIQAIVAKISECEAAAQQAGQMAELINKLGLYVDTEGYTCQRLAGES